MVELRQIPVIQMDARSKGVQLNRSMATSGLRSVLVRRPNSPCPVFQIYSVDFDGMPTRREGVYGRHEPRGARHRIADAAGVPDGANMVPDLWTGGARRAAAA